MPNPWNLAFPVQADGSDALLYEWVGRTVDHWERVEFELSRMYSLFCGDPEWSKMQEYGTGTIFRQRIAALGRVAEAWFRRSPDQEVEGLFSEIVARAKGFADRRNEVAHGMVMNVATFLFWQDKLGVTAPNIPQFLLVPPYFLLRKHDTFGLPAFGYSTTELHTITMRLSILERDIDSFNKRVWPPESRSKHRTP